MLAQFENFFNLNFHFTYSQYETKVRFHLRLLNHLRQQQAVLHTRLTKIYHNITAKTVLKKELI